MKRKSILTIIFILLFSCCKGYNKKHTFYKVESLIYACNEITLEQKLILFSQSILETSYFKNTKYNNIFGIMDNNKKVRYNSFKDCLNHRLSLIKKYHKTIHDNYATDCLYFNKINNIMKKTTYNYHFNKKFLTELLLEIEKDNLEYLSYSDNRFLKYNENRFRKLLSNLNIPYQSIDNQDIYILDKEHIEELKKTYSITI